jgi:hypothetical protein
MTRAPHAIAHTAAAASDFTVTPGTPGITAVMTGDTAPPHVVLVDPHGRTYDTGAGNDPVDGNGEIALKDPDHNMTEIAVWSPAPGHWSVMPAADSSALTSTKYALGMRQPTVTAHVRGQGYTRALAYKTTGLQPGDTVTFTESGHGGQFIATLSKVPAGAKQTADGLTRTGLINFTPAIGPSELRNVIATVVGADGVPRASINLGVYKSPPAATPARVTDVKFALSKRGRLAVGWTQPHGVLPVQTYNVLVKLSDGRVITFLPRSPRVTVTGVHSGERVTATIAGVSAAGTTSRARTVHARVHVPGARKHKNRPRRKHRPQIPR